MAYAVVRTDSMSGVTDATLLAHGRYKDNDAYAEIENGSIVVVGDLEDGEREVRQFSDVTASTKIDEVALVAAPELIKDTCTHKDLSDWINPAGVATRGYRFHSHDVFSVSAEAFDGAVPTVGQTVAVKADSHKMVAGTGALTIGKCIEIETLRYVTMYAIEVDM